MKNSDSRRLLTFALVAAVVLSGCTRRPRVVVEEFLADEELAVAGLFREIDGPVDDILTVFGATWCGPCKTLIDYLGREGISYRYYVLEPTSAAKAVNRALEENGIPIPEKGARVGIPIIVNRVTETGPPLASRGFLNWTDAHGNERTQTIILTVDGSERRIPVTRMLPASRLAGNR